MTKSEILSVRSETFKLLFSFFLIFAKVLETGEPVISCSARGADAHYDGAYLSVSR